MDPRLEGIAVIDPQHLGRVDPCGGPRWPGTAPDDAAHWQSAQRFGATYVLRGRKVMAMVIPLRPGLAPVGVPATGAVLVPRARQSLRACA